MTKNLIPAFQKNEALIVDIKKHQNTEGVHIWWLGQSGFLLSWKGKQVLFDPYLSDSLTLKYAETKKPHIRMSELVVNPDALNMIDIVTSSHNHTDHLDADTLIPLFQANPKMAFIIPEANRSFIAHRVKCPPDVPYGLSDGDMLKIKEFTFTGVPAAHNTIDRDDNGKLKYMGFVVQFGNYAIYHSGDTIWYDRIVDILKPFNLDIAFLPINGNKPEREVAGNLDCAEAAELGKQIGAKCVIPHHYDMFAFNTADVNDFVKESEKRHQPFKVLRIGERFSLR